MTATPPTMRSQFTLEIVRLAQIWYSSEDQTEASAELRRVVLEYVDAVRRRDFREQRMHTTKRSQLIGEIISRAVDWCAHPASAALLAGAVLAYRQARIAGEIPLVPTRAPSAKVAARKRAKILAALGRPRRGPGKQPKPLTDKELGEVAEMDAAFATRKVQ